MIAFVRHRWPDLALRRRIEISSRSLARMSAFIEDMERNREDILRRLGLEEKSKERAT